MLLSIGVNYMLKILTICLTMAVSANAAAMGPTTGYGDTNPTISDVNPYYQADHFQWGNYNDDVHLLTAYSITVVGALLLERKAHLSNWQAALIMTLAVGMLGTAKEVLHDEYTSRTDIKTWWGGAAAGGLTVWAFQF